MHVNVTGHPTAQWTARQIRNVFPWDTAPRYLLRDRDGTYGPAFRAGLYAIGIEDVQTAPRSPWQDPYVERVIGSIRRECASITSSCSMSDPCSGCCDRMSPTTITGARISRWAKMLR